MGANEITIRESWLAVARAAAEHRRVAAGDEVFSALRCCVRAPARAPARLTGAIGRALEADVEQAEIVDALRSGDPGLEVSRGAGAGRVERQPRAAARAQREGVLRDLSGRADGLGSGAARGLGG